MFRIYTKGPEPTTGLTVGCTEMRLPCALKALKTGWIRNRERALGNTGRQILLKDTKEEESVLTTC